MSIANHVVGGGSSGRESGQVQPRRQDDQSQQAQRRQIEMQARKQLRQSAYLPVRDVDCAYRDGVLTLRGRVPSYYLKQVAQAAVLDRLEGLVVLDNQLVVDRD